MPAFDIHTAETAPEAKDLLDGAQKAFGFVPNLLATMAESPALLEGYMTLAGIFDKTDLSATERQIVLMVNNRLNGCSYCMSAHSTISQMQGVPADVIEALRNGTPIANPKLEALRQFAVRVNESRGWPEQADIDALFAAGYSKRTVFEVVLGTGLKTLSNYTNHIASTPIDAAFSANAWSPEAVEAPVAAAV
ncbi:MAG: carboxymuconolactone decarboxylase family protein [Acidobacteriota bacterium]